MKRLLLGVFAMFCSTLAYSQATEIVVETYAENIGMQGAADLTGYNTYRLYAKFSSSEDFLAAVYGDADFPTKVQADNNFYNSPLGGLTNASYNAIIFNGFPDLEYDSFVTVGMEAPANTSAGEAPINTVGDPMSDWSVAFEPGLGAAGSDIIIDTQTGGSWFPLFPDSNAYAGPDSLIMIGQFTTNNVLYGVVSISTFAGGVQSDVSTVTLPFSSTLGAVFGCTDMDATNFNMDATDDDGSCVYACDYPATQLMITATMSMGVSCSGYADGQATVMVSGGQGGLLYDNGMTTNATGIFANQSAGEVMITVTDAQNCSVDTTVMVDTPDPLMVTASLTDPISCAGEADAVLSGTSTGGTGAVEYSMMAPLTDSTGMPYFEMGSETLLFEGIGSGLYTVYGIDENGCTDQTPGIQVTAPPPFNLYAQAVASTTCPDSEDGTVVLNFFGGSGNSTTFSADGMMYSEESTYTIAPGTYTFYAQDVNGCPDTLTDVTVTTPPAFESLAELVSPSCFGDMDGSIAVEVQGGTVPLDYVVDGDTLNTVMLSMVGAGDYAIEVVDSNGCSYDASVTLTEPTQIVPTGAVTDVLCNGDDNGALVVTATGGTGMGYTYNLDGAGFGPNGEFAGLEAGDYTVTVQDDSECTGTVDVTVGGPDAIAVNVDANAGASGAESDGVIDITVTGGTEPYNYSWDGPGFTSEDEDATGVAAGDYTVTITDANGCVFTSTTIVVVSGLDEIVNAVDVTLFPNPTNGLVEVSMTGLAGESVMTVMLDGLGREVSREDLGNLSGQFVQRMDLAEFESGVYFLRLEVADSVEVLRVVKQ